jgi:hypothetical protein
MKTVKAEEERKTFRDGRMCICRVYCGCSIFVLAVIFIYVWHAKIVLDSCMVVPNLITLNLKFRARRG